MMPDAVGRKIISQPIYFAAMMVKEGEAHGMVAGINYPTEEVIIASELILGLQEEVSIPSSFYLLDIPGFNGAQGSLMIFADPSINPDPTPGELADIAYSTAQRCVYKQFIQPRFFYLSTDELWKWKVNALNFMGNNYKDRYKVYIVEACQDNNEKIRDMARKICRELSLYED